MDREVQIKSGEIKAIPEEGIIKVSIIGRKNNVTSGLLYGFGGDIGGLGTSIGVFNPMFTT